MDPSRSDPDHSPSQYAPFATFPTSNNSFVSSPDTAPTHHFYDAQQPLSEIFNHGFQPQPEPQPHTLPQSQHQHQPLPMSQFQPQPQPHPHPLLMPLPHSQHQHQPQPYPLPMPQFQPEPQHLPQPHPLPMSQSQPMPQSQPEPQHLPLSLPMPQPQHMPQPEPQPHPLPLSQSQPHPLPLSQSQPQHLHEAQHEPQAPPQSSPSQAAHLPTPPYTEMICNAIAALNERDGSSKLAISKYIERSYPDFRHADGSLMSHHLNTLKSCGVLSMVKNSYKFADSPPPESVAIADAGLVAPRSEIPLTNTGPLGPLDPVDASASGSVAASASGSASGSVAASASGSASQPQKRGRGRPPKPKPEAPQQEQSINVQPNGLPSQEQPEMPVTNPNQVVTESAKRRRGRPRKDGAVPVVPAAAMPQAASMAVLMKRRGRPPGRRAAGRQRKPISVPAAASVLPVASNVAPAGDETMAVAPGINRGRGRPPKIGGVRNKVITKPKRGGGRPAGRPRKKTTWTVRGPTGRLERVNVATATPEAADGANGTPEAVSGANGTPEAADGASGTPEAADGASGTPEAVSGATGTFEAACEELKRKMHLAREKVKHISIVLQDGIASGDVQAAAAQAREDMEGLLPMLIVEPQVEEVPPKDAALQTEIETQNEEQEREVVGEQAQTEIQTQHQAEAVAMQDTIQPETEPETQPQAEAVAMQDTIQPQAEAVAMQDTIQPETEPEIQPEIQTQPQAEAVAMQDTVQPETEPETQPQAEAVAMQDTVQPETKPETEPQAEAVAMQETGPAKTA